MRQRCNGRRQRQWQHILWSNNQPPPLVMGVNCALHCLQCKSFGRIIPFVPLLCCVSNDLSKGGNRCSNRFFSRCVLFNVFIYHLPQHLKYIVPNQFHSEAGVKHIGWFLWRATTLSCLPQALAHSWRQRHGQRSRQWWWHHYGRRQQQWRPRRRQWRQWRQHNGQLWTGDLSKEDRKVINSRVIGYNGLQLPPIFEGKQTENFCNQPIQKNSTTIISFPNWTTCQNILFRTGKLWSINVIMLLPRRCLLCMSNKQRTQLHTKSIISKAHKHHTPKYN